MAVVGLAVSFYKNMHPPEIKVCPSYIPKGSADVRNKININTADVKQLSTLSGIGPELAKKIIAFRGKNGFFNLPEDIIKVPGIGKAKYESIKDFITVEEQ